MTRKQITEARVLWVVSQYKGTLTTEQIRHRANAMTDAQIAEAIAAWRRR